MAEKSAFTTLGLTRELERFAWEARARITCGDTPAGVRDWLLGNGVGDRMADEIIVVCLQERARSWRGKGPFDLLFGIAVIALGFSVAALTFFGNAACMVWALCFLSVVCILDLTFGGGERLLMGARTRGADTDVV